MKVVVLGGGSTGEHFVGALRRFDHEVQITLVENGLVQEKVDPHYAWDRRRVIGERFEITSLGKSYLLRAIEDSERIR